MKPIEDHPYLKKPMEAAVKAVASAIPPSPQPAGESPEKNELLLEVRRLRKIAQDAEGVMAQAIEVIREAYLMAKKVSIAHQVREELLMVDLGIPPREEDEHETHLGT